MDKLLLAKLAKEHNSQRKIAEVVGCSYRTVGRWMKKYKIEITPTMISKERLDECIALGYGENKSCAHLNVSAGTYRRSMKHHGLKSPHKDFSPALYFDNMGSCVLCGKKCHKRTICGECTARATRRGIKSALVFLKGGKCEQCGYDKSIAALDFHHTNPNGKEIALNQANAQKHFLTYVEEIKKCELLCTRCHRERHETQDLKNADFKTVSDATMQQLLVTMGTL